jgi:HEAT repeat protein
MRDRGTARFRMRRDSRSGGKTTALRRWLTHWRLDLWLALDLRYGMVSRSPIMNPLRFCDPECARPVVRRAPRSARWRTVSSQRRSRSSSTLARSPDPYLRRAGLEAIGDHPSGRDASDVVLNLLHDRTGFVVRTACDVAGVLGLTGGHDRILELAGADEEATRLSALSALERLWVPPDFEKVFARYVHDRSDDVRKRAAWTINRNVRPEHWKRVFELWASDRLARHRVWACSIAERFGDRTALATLNALLSDLDGHVRRAAERASKAIGES